MSEPFDPQKALEEENAVVNPASKKVPSDDKDAPAGDKPWIK